MTTNIKPINLDALAAWYGFEIVNKIRNITKKKTEIENLITKSLGVLQEQGVYAFFLYLFSEVKIDKNKNFNPDEKKEIKFIEKIVEYLKSNEINLTLFNIDNNLEQYEKKRDKLLIEIREKICEDIDKLSFVYWNLNQALFYARYHAKALIDIDYEEKKGKEKER